MDKRLISFLLGCVLGVLLFLSCIGVSYAQSSEYWRMNSMSFPTAEAACQYRLSQVSGSTYVFSHVGPLNPSNATRSCWAVNSKNSSDTWWYADAQRMTCAGSTVFNPATGTCGEPPPPTCAAGRKGSGRWQAGYEGKSVIETGGCVGGCRVNMTGVQSCWGPVGGNCSDGKCSCIYDYEMTASQCTPGLDAPGTVPDPGAMPRTDMPPAKPPPGKSCPAGTVQGGTDSAGTPICIGTGSAPKNSPPPPPKVESEKTTQNADGSTTTTKTTTTTNSDGSTTTTVETVIKFPDGSTKTDTQKDTSNTPAGTPGKDESNKQDEKYDLCKQNPMLAICRNSSVSGSCGQISCEGDAIQCATLRAAAAMQCQQEEDKKALEQSPMKTLGQQIIEGNDPVQGEIDAVLKGREVDMSKEVLDDSGFVGGGSCFPDKSINVLGKTVTVSFARVCQDIQPLRAAIMACAFLVAYLIVSKSVLQG